jgi:hypothetical protein
MIPDLNSDVGVISDYGIKLFKALWLEEHSASQNMIFMLPPFLFLAYHVLNSDFQKKQPCYSYTCESSMSKPNTK